MLKYVVMLVFDIIFISILIYCFLIVDYNVLLKIIPDRLWMIAATGILINIFFSFIKLHVKRKAIKQAHIMLDPKGVIYDNIRNELSKKQDQNP